MYLDTGLLKEKTHHSQEPWRGRDLVVILRIAILPPEIQSVHSHPRGALLVVIEIPCTDLLGVCVA